MHSSCAIAHSGASLTSHNPKPSHLGATLPSHDPKPAHTQVRDRATLYLKQMGGEAGGLAAISTRWQISAKNLEESLHLYLSGPMLAPFDLVSCLKTLPITLLAEP